MSDIVKEKYCVFDIEYDTDEEKIDLPKELIIEIELEQDEVGDEDHISDLLSDEISDITGFCHYGFSSEKIEEDDSK